ncbi:hypothetical protein EDF56_11168 [Novosphingobium sp. PhB165]|nr:hypothetical protein EDF56_11168 [Novosphingobium sp. PhB165]
MIGFTRRRGDAEKKREEGRLDSRKGAKAQRSRAAPQASSFSGCCSTRYRRNVKGFAENTTSLRLCAFARIPFSSPFFSASPRLRVNPIPERHHAAS